MAVPFKYTFEQGPMIAALGRVALSGLKKNKPARAPVTPGPWLEDRVAPRSDELIRAYVKHVGGDPAWYKGRVPPHLFPQWSFPLGARALEGLGYPLAKVINGGCRIEQKAPLPSGEPLDVRVRIESIDDDGARAIITQRVVTGTARVPDATTAYLRAFIPLAKKKDAKGGKKDRPTVPADAHELSFVRINDDAGLDFAKLTGDFNPIHWIPAAARASGFRTVILHGFSTLARAIEGLNRSRLSGDPMQLSFIDARFSRPLVLPARVGIYVNNDGGIWVGDAPGGGAYLEGRFETKGRT
jgi:acyl dehydratase